MFWCDLCQRQHRATREGDVWAVKVPGRIFVRHRVDYRMLARGSVWDVTYFVAKSGIGAGIPYGAHEPSTFGFVYGSTAAEAAAAQRERRGAHGASANGHAGGSAGAGGSGGRGGGKGRKRGGRAGRR